MSTHSEDVDVLKTFQEDVAALILPPDGGQAILTAGTADGVSRVVCAAKSFGSSFGRVDVAVEEKRSVIVRISSSPHGEGFVLFRQSLLAVGGRYGWVIIWT